MNIGIPKETRPFEYRVGLSPAGVEISDPARASGLRRA